jgi:hypothetical protein
MGTITLDQAIETINQLPIEQQEMLITIFQKRLIEAHRQQIAQDAQESLTAFRQGKYTPQSAEQVISELHEASEDYDA